GVLRRKSLQGRVSRQRAGLCWQRTETRPFSGTRQGSMKWVTAGVTFVNLSVVCGLFLGLAGRGLTTMSAALALVCGVAFAVAAFLGTRDTAVRGKLADSSAADRESSKASEVEKTQNAISPALVRYRRVWF